jgi:hypothetical protein
MIDEGTSRNICDAAGQSGKDTEHVKHVTRAELSVERRIAQAAIARSICL